MNEKKPIRVLHVLYGMDLAGTETLLMNLYRNIDRNKVQFDFAVCAGRECAYDKEILYTLRKMSTTEISNLPDVSEGLEFALKNAANQCNSVVELLSIIKSKRYTQTRLQRILLYAMLGITKRDMEISVTTSPYIRVLGFNDKGQELISEISKRNRKLEIVTSVKKFMDKKSNNNLKLMMDKDIWATDVYTLGFEYDSKANLDYTHKLII